MGVWSQAEIDNLPDSSFAAIEPGGTKDAEGKTTPRSKRHLPYKDEHGTVNEPHLRDALSRIATTQISSDLKASAQRKLDAAARGAGIGDHAQKSAISRLLKAAADLLSGSVEPIEIPGLFEPVVKGDREELEHFVALVKDATNEEQRLVYGIVYEPGVEDAHGDTMTAAEIEKAAHGFMTHYARLEGDSGTDHLAKVGRHDVTIVESSIAPADYQLGGQTVKKGSWVMAAKIWNDQLWKGVRTGKFTGWSFEGYGRRERNAA